MRDVLGLTVGYGLLTVTGNEHRQMRKTMNPAFAIPNLMARAFILASLSRDIADNLLQRLTCIMRLLIGMLMNCLDYWLGIWIWCDSLLEIIGSQIDAVERPEHGKEFLMYEWSRFLLCPPLFSLPDHFRSEQSYTWYCLFNCFWIQVRLLTQPAQRTGGGIRKPHQFTGWWFKILLPPNPVNMASL